MMQKRRSMITETTSRFLLEWVLYLYFILFFLIYPLYYEDKYYNMGDAKWHFFRSMTYGFKGSLYFPGLLTLALIFFLWYLVHLIRTGEGKVIKAALFRSSLTDRFVLAYAIAITLSTALSPYKNVVFFGYSGWYMGYFAQMSFVLLYFFFSRFHSEMKLGYILALGVAFFIMFIAILNRFSFDPLSMFDGMMPHQASKGALGGFLSTIGQTTWYGSYVSLMLPFGIYPFLQSDRWWIRLLSGIYGAAAAMTIVTARADSLFLSVIGIFGVCLYISLGNRQGEILKQVMRFWEMMLLFLVMFRVTGILRERFPEQAIIINDSIPKFLCHSKWMYLFIMIAAVLVLAAFLVNRRKEASKDRATWEAKEYKISIWVRRVIFGLAFLTLAAVIGFIIYNSGPYMPDDKRSMHNYFLFNNWWGHYRGISWRSTTRAFLSSITENPRQFLFGTGPDAFYQAVYVPNKDAFAKFFNNAVLTNAHNEWMTIFINAGLFGGIAYWGIFLSAFASFIKESRENRLCLPMAAVIAGYVCYNAFCYQQIICTPMIFILMGLGQYFLRHRSSF